MAAPVSPLFPNRTPSVQFAPNGAEIFPSPNNPMAVARQMLADKVDDGQHLVRYWRDQWMKYEGPHWVEMEERAVRKWIYDRLEHVEYEHINPTNQQRELRAWNPNRSKVADVKAALESIVLLAQDTEAPSWLDTGDAAGGFIACANGLVGHHDQKLRRSTPRYFGIVSVPFDYDENVAEPTEWLQFLRTLWPQVQDADGDTVDADEINALQQWFGYVLSGRMDLQKILLMVGPPRCGKGTIARVLQKLVGRGNHVAPTLASLGTNFGLAPLIGKSLAVVGDARLGGPGQEQITERLLSISGEDNLTVDRKNRDVWSGRLPARFMVLSNELPKFGDVSGAIASRFIILTLEESFLGREDTDLEPRLEAELSGILKWALDGLVRLNRQRRITVPEQSAQSMTLLQELVSPMTAFLRDVCVVDPEASVATGDLYREYGAWCEENGRGRSSIQKWSSDLRTLLPRCRTDYRPKIDGVMQPRRTTGLRINPEWAHRVREDTGTGWRNTGGDTW